jgi:acetyl-CoA carboxylase carboxyltransferase component
MGSRAIGADRVLAWPAAQIGLLGARGAVALQGHAGDAARESEHLRQVLSPAASVQAGAVDEIIVPRRTREHVARALQLLAQKTSSSAPVLHGERAAPADHD